MSLRTYTSIVICCLILTGCEKEKPEEPIEPEQGSLILQWENKVGTMDLVLDTVRYINAHNDTFTVTKLNYYISNIQLKATDGSIYQEKESYHLVKSIDPSTWKFKLSKVPPNMYTSISFIIGVDSIRNVSGAQTGALDPAEGMFWSWNSGYIMSKLEGSYWKADGTEELIMFHPGGFAGANSVIRSVQLALPSAASVTLTQQPTIVLAADVLEWFKTPYTIDLTQLNVVHSPGADAAKIASNYADMFTVTKVIN